LARLQRFKSWFKNHDRPSSQTQAKKRSPFEFKKETKKLSDLQCFTKLYYRRYYKKSTQIKWCDTYPTFHRRTREELVLAVAGAETDTDTDENGMEKKVGESMREAHQDGLLDVTVAAASVAEVDDGEEENLEARTSPDGIKLPRVPIWYMNAVMQHALEGASLSQQNAVEDYKTENCKKTAAKAGDETEAPEDKVTRLERVI
jgi:hypothetical protein